MKQHHLGVACEDRDATCAQIEKLHQVVEKTDVIFDDQQQVHVQLLTLIDGTNLELVAGKVVQGLLKKRVNLYHICFEVADIDNEVKNAVVNGAILISTPKPSALFAQRKVCFLMYPYGLVEFLQQDADSASQ
jgi:methylmalonyl-CoA/ethylmalonyl-CoA epimerase